MTDRSFNRRAVLTGLAAVPLAAHPAFGQEPIEAHRFNLRADSEDDQTAQFLEACNAAADAGQPLFLPAGIYVVGAVDLPGRLLLQGVPGGSILRVQDGNGVVRITDTHHVTLDGIVVDGALTTSASVEGLLKISNCYNVNLVRCMMRDCRTNGIAAYESEVRIDDCEFGACDEAGIFSMDGRGIRVSASRITSCGNGGILIWRSENGRDRSIISGNWISTIDNRAGGNGQYGNAINIFRADEVIVADNHIADVMFSAVRINSSNDTQVSGNTCMNCKETAIYSEFAFSGSVIANNIVDGAAAGISITNFDQGGRLAMCSGNIVRNILPRSEVNPDITPVGIFAEADTVIADNVVEAVPGAGIAAGWGPYLRDVSITGNLVRNTDIGIAVSVADGAGSALVSDNLIAGARRAGIAGMAWADVVSDDLVRDAASYPNVAVDGNRVG